MEHVLQDLNIYQNQDYKGAEDNTNKDFTRIYYIGRKLAQGSNSLEPPDSALFSTSQF